MTLFWRLAPWPLKITSETGAASWVTTNHEPRSQNDEAPQCHGRIGDDPHSKIARGTLGPRVSSDECRVTSAAHPLRVDLGKAVKWRLKACMHRLLRHPLFSVTAWTLDLARHVHNLQQLHLHEPAQSLQAVRARRTRHLRPRRCVEFCLFVFFFAATAQRVLTERPPETRMK